MRREGVRRSFGSVLAACEELRAGNGAVLQEEQEADSAVQGQLAVLRLAADHAEEQGDAAVCDRKQVFKRGPAIHTVSGLLTLPCLFHQVKLRVINSQKRYEEFGGRSVVDATRVAVLAGNHQHFFPLLQRGLDLVQHVDFERDVGAHLSVTDVRLRYHQTVQHHVFRLARRHTPQKVLERRRVHDGSVQSLQHLLRVRTKRRLPPPSDVCTGTTWRERLPAASPSSTPPRCSPSAQRPAPSSM